MRVLDKTYLKIHTIDTMEEETNIPKWANFLCPSCAVAYGVTALAKAIRKRKERKSVKTADV